MRRCVAVSVVRTNSHFSGELSRTGVDLQALNSQARGCALRSGTEGHKPLAGVDSTARRSPNKGLLPAPSASIRGWRGRGGT